VHPDGTVLRGRVLPDAASDIVEGNGLWVAGCRNGWVYAYSVVGEQVWNWRMPPDEWGDYWEGAGPDRLRVAATVGRVAVAYGERLWLLTGEGQAMWEYSLPKPDSDPATGERATRSQTYARLVSVFGGEVLWARTAQLRFSLAAARGSCTPARRIDPNLQPPRRPVGRSQAGRQSSERTGRHRLAGAKPIWRNRCSSGRGVCR
jgi:hypothetical protein